MDDTIKINVVPLSTDRPEAGRSGYSPLAVLDLAETLEIHHGMVNREHEKSRREM
jgi:hypothetical protein